MNKEINIENLADDILKFGEYIERNEILFLIENQLCEIKKNNKIDDDGDEHYAGQKYALEKLKEKISERETE